MLVYSVVLAWTVGRADCECASQVLFIVHHDIMLWTYPALALRPELRPKPRLQRLQKIAEVWPRLPRVDIEALAVLVTLLFGIEGEIERPRKQALSANHELPAVVALSLRRHGSSSKTRVHDQKAN